MKKLCFIAGVLLAALLLNACQTTELSTGSVQQAPLRTSPVDVVSAYISPQAITPQDIDISQGNLFDNGGFEAGLAGWTGCDTGAIAESSDAYEGSKALKVTAGNCFYRSVEVSVAQELVLSCYVRLESGSGWTGMGLGFADANWTTIASAPATIITGNTYQRYDVKATAPAGSKYASMWLYSDNPVVVDNCSLMLEEDPTEPPTGSGDNLLDNGGFETLDESNKPVNWTKGCGGQWSSISTNGTKGIQVSGGACVDQGLSATDIAALSGKDYTYSCYLKQTGGFTSISIFLDGEPKSFARATESTNTDFELFEVKGTAGQISNGFVSIYSSQNASASDNAKIDYCTLTVDGGEPPSGGNLIENGGFESLDATNKPNNWTKGCGGTWTSVAGRSGNGLKLENGVCVDQTLSSADLSTLAGKDYTYSCYAKNTGGYASMSIFLNGQAESVVIPVSNSYQLVELKGSAGQLSSGFISIYSEASLTVDDCQLQEDGDNPQPSGTPSIDIRNNVEGPDTYALSGPYTFEVVVRNNGDVTLTNVDLSSDVLSCTANFSILAVGESQIISCASTVVATPTQGFSHIMTATATTADGQVVTDSDQSGYRVSLRASPKIFLDIATDNRVVAAGSDVTFFVTVANGGNVSGIAEVTSNVADCSKLYTPALNSGDIETYQCVESNVQESFIATVSSETIGAYRANASDSVEVVIEDTVALDISSNTEGLDVVNVDTDQNPEPYSFTINVRNNGAVKMTNVQVTSDAVQTCTQTIAGLEIGETKSYTCEAPVLAPGQRISQTVTAVGTTADNRQATDSDTTEIYRQSDIQLDVSLGSEGDDIINVPSGQSLNIDITLKNTGFVDFNNIQALYIYRSNPFNASICQAAIPYSGIGDPDVAFDLAAGQTKTFTCTLQNITSDLELTLVAYLSNTDLLSFLANEEVFSYDPDKLLIKVN